MAIPTSPSFPVARIPSIKGAAMQVKRAPEVHDVIVIGSGAAGGMAAWNLTRKGGNVLMLDAGEKFDRAKFWSHVKPWEGQQRVDRGRRPPQFYLDSAG